MFDEDRLYRPDDLADFVSASTLAHMRCEGRGPAYTRFGGRIFYAGAELNKSLRRNTVCPAGRTSAPAKEQPTVAA